MTTRERMAKAILDRHIKIFADRLVEAKLTGTMRVQQFDEDHFQQLASAAFDILSARPSDDVIFAGAEEIDRIGLSQGTMSDAEQACLIFESMIAAIKEEK